MSKILGLDLGTNSLGWAIVDPDNEKIIDSGVRIFPEGVVDKGQGEGKEMSKNATRTEHRQSRKQNYRKRLRKIKLLEVLIENYMCPLEKKELDKWGKWDKIKKSEARKFPQTDEFKEWLKLNPYQLRDKALKEDITKLEFGRILYHLIQRRGFYSSRKSNDSGALYKGNDNMVGVDRTEKEIDNNTLGSYFNSIYPEENQSYEKITDEKGNELKIRGRYTIRDWYVEEFDKIWNKQAKHLGLNNIKVEKKKKVILKGGKNRNRNQKKINYLKENRDKIEVEEMKFKNKDGIYKTETTVISSNLINLKEYLAGEITYENGSIKYNNKDSVLFYQRPLKTQKHLVGKCRYETNKTPAYKSHPLFEEFRTWQFLNTIEYDTRKKLSLKQKETAFSLFINKKAKFKFKDIIKKLKLEDYVFNYESDYSVINCKTISNLHTLFPNKIWNENYHEIWHDFHFYDSNEKLQEKLNKKYGVEIPLKTLDKIKLDDDYSNISLKAIKNILPFLKKGMQYNKAVVFGGIKNAFNYGDDINRWDNFKSEHEIIIKDISNFINKNNKKGELLELIKNYLIKGGFGFSENDKAFTKLYHHSQEAEQKKLKFEISEIENLRNPIVQRSLQEIKRVTNDLINEYGYSPEESDKPFDRVVVEMSRDLKANKESRNKIRRINRQNENKNIEAKEILTNHGLAHSRENIQKYLLYKEIEDKNGLVICPYTGKTVSLSALLGSGNKFQIEHIFPRSTSLDDSFSNKTICEAKFNQLKGNKTPYEFYKSNNDKNLWGVESWDEVEMRAFKLLPYRKAKKFISRKLDLDTSDFISRQLNDNRYISKKTKEIMSEICDDVRVTPGQLTSNLRRLWGLNNVLQPMQNISSKIKKYDENNAIPHYAIVNVNNNEVESLKPVFNDKPKSNKDELIILGEAKKGKFKSKKFNLEFSDNEITDGENYAKLKLSKPLSVTAIYKKPPVVNEDYLLISGSIYKNQFKNKNLNKNIETEDLENGNYWAKIKINKIDFNKDKNQKAKPDYRLFGEIKDNRFISYIYTKNINYIDGKYWADFTLNFDEVEFIKKTNDEPKTKDGQIILKGDVNDDAVFIATTDTDFKFQTEEKEGKYWALFDIISTNPEFTLVENKIPDVDKEHKIVKGNVIVSKSDGEIKFDPAKNRDDNRHHAIDAITIAFTEQSYLQKLSTYNARKDEKKRENKHEKPEFPEPWNGFRNDVEKSVNNILVSYHQSNPVLKLVNKRFIKDGKKMTSRGLAVAGQLHKENVYGKRKTLNKEKAFHIRKEVKSLTKAQVKKIADDNIRAIIENAIEREKEIKKEIDKLKKEKQTAGDIDEKRIESKISEWNEIIKNLYTLPNKNGDRVPIKKVRIRENIGNTETLKPSNPKNQNVNLKNNHHLIIYKDFNGEYNDKVYTLWESVELKRQGKNLQSLPENGEELIASLEENDLFIFNMSKDELNDCIKTNNSHKISKNLYRVITSIRKS